MSFRIFGNLVFIALGVTAFVSFEGVFARGPGLTMALVGVANLAAANVARDREPRS